MIKKVVVGLVGLVAVSIGSPVLAVTTSFRIGVCCDQDAGSSGCNSTVCDADADCSGGKVCAGSVLSFVNAVGVDLSPATWNPVFDSCEAGQPTLAVQKSEVIGIGEVSCGLIVWDTSALSNILPVTAANLILQLTSCTSDDARTFTGDWLDWTPCAANDWTLSCPTDGFEVPITCPATPVEIIIPLADLGEISVTGTSGLRLCISGGAPSSNGVNRLIFASFANTTLAGPQLEVEQDDNTPTSTATSINTATSTRTATATNTVTVTATGLNTATVTNTPTVTPTPVDTNTPTNTGTVTQTPTITPTSPPSGDDSGMTGLLAMGSGCCCTLGRGGGGEVITDLFAQGCYEGNGNDNRAIATGIVNPGWLIVSQKETNGLNHDGMHFRAPEMTTDQSCYIVSSGAQCPTNRIQDQSVDGYFVVGTAQEVNAAGDDYCWYQWSLGENHTTFQYTGDGLGARTIDVGMENPSIAFIRPKTNGSGSMWVRSSTMPANESTPWDGFNITATSNITALGPTGITVSAAFNSSGTVFVGGAWKAGSGYGGAFSWTGDGTSGVGGTCGLAGDVQTITASCTTNNVIAAQCASNGCQGENCSQHNTGSSFIRGKNIGSAVVGPGNTGISDLYAQGTLGDSASLMGNLTGSTFDVTGGPNAAASLNDLGATYHGWVTCAPGPVIGTVNLPDWSFDANMLAVWHMEEASSTTRTNNDCNPQVTGGTFLCGNNPACDCDMDNNATVIQDTAEKIIGSASALFVAADTDYLNRSLATANELNITGDVDLSWGAFMRPTTDDANRFVMMKASNDYSLSRRTATDTPVCAITESDNTLNETFLANNASPLNTWVAVACVHTAAANTINIYGNGVISGNVAFNVASIRDSAGTLNEFRFGRNATTTYWDGQVDEAWIYNGIMSATDVCRIHSCGVTGGACSCYVGNPTVYVDTGYNTTLGGNCTLPACNKAGPS